LFLLFFASKVAKEKAEKKLIWGRCNKTFYNRNLRIFVKARAFDPGEPFQPSLMFVGKAVAYPRVEQMKVL
jgi:hypothetical protein